MTEWNSISDHRVSNTSPSQIRGNIRSNKMKAVLFVVATLMAVSIHAQSCNIPKYESTIDTPNACIKEYKTLKVPNYENPSSHYQCDAKTNTTTLVNCSEDTYFCYVLQACVSCNDYIPTVRCEGLTINVTCVPMNSTNESTTTASTTVKDDSTESSSSSTTTTTTTSTTTTTEAPGESSTTTTTAATTTTTSAPTPPTDDETTTSTASDDSVVTPSGTTIDVPGPPSPADSDVPSPETPVPTAPVIEDGPPTPSS